MTDTSVLPAPRTGIALMRATQPFAVENRARSWRELVIALALVAAAITGAALLSPWPLRLAASVLAALSAVRGFIHYHDFMHGAILGGSRLARAILYVFGALVLTPPRSWAASHDFHHAHVGQLEASSIGSFPILTVEEWKNASTLQRIRYRIARNPLTLLFAFATVFIYSICLESLLENPRKHWDSAIVLLLHAVLGTAIGWFFGFEMLLFTYIVPTVTASAVGAYLFYAQHNFEEVQIRPTVEWTYHSAALETSSFMKLGPVMRFFTGNIGFHHVHHLNQRIPFYRLPEAMAAIPELQNPRTTSLHPREIWRCLSLKLWDPAQGRMVGYPKRGAMAAA